ncbi:MAG TPA: CBS domain-containing protein [Nitrococcus sp.]|nr:CBS domain-containing protein [Nitrococcus sp.]
MDIREVMHRDSYWAQPTTPLIDIARAMREHDIGSLPVVESDKLVGMVTDRDLAIRGLADGRDASSTTARDIMTGEMYWCYDDTDVNEVAKYMQEKRVRRIPVVNHDKRLVGMVSIGDITRASTELAGETLRKLSAVGD